MAVVLPTPLSSCCRRKACPLSLFQDVDHHGVPHTKTHLTMHAQGGIASDLCMLGDVHHGHGGDSPPPPTKVNSHHGTLHPMAATTRVHTMGGSLCTTTEELPLIVSSSLVFFSLVFLLPPSLWKNASFIDKQKRRHHPTLFSTSSEP